MRKHEQYNLKLPWTSRALSNNWLRCTLGDNHIYSEKHKTVFCAFKNSLKEIKNPIQIWNFLFPLDLCVSHKASIITLTSTINRYGKLLRKCFDDHCLTKIGSVMKHLMSKGSHLLFVFHFKAFIFRQEGLGNVLTFLCFEMNFYLFILIYCCYYFYYYC